ncbi:MAG: hypothetical protein CTY19_14980 [Methylomonas sp.]|nr:MAG: hypothetical protein CTY19_14980 [Methylomonas sp.]
MLTYGEGHSIFTADTLRIEPQSVGTISFKFGSGFIPFLPRRIKAVWGGFSFGRRMNTDWLRARMRFLTLVSSFCNCINQFGFLLNYGTVLFPLFRPEHRGFWRELPDRGAAGMPLVFGGLRIALPKILAKSEKRRIKAEFGCRFFWILFFGQAKKSIAVVGPRTDIKSSCRDSETTYISSLIFPLAY